MVFKARREAVIAPSLDRKVPKRNSPCFGFPIAPSECVHLICSRSALFPPPPLEECCKSATKHRVVHQALTASLSLYLLSLLYTLMVRAERCFYPVSASHPAHASVSCYPLCIFMLRAPSCPHSAIPPAIRTPPCSSLISHLPLPSQSSSPSFPSSANTHLDRPLSLLAISASHTRICYTPVSPLIHATDT